jgi:hypothetical protein
VIAQSSEQAHARLLRTLSKMSDQVNTLLGQMRDHVLADAAANKRTQRRLSLADFEPFVHQLYSTESLPMLGMGFLPHPDVLPNFPVRWWYNSGTAATAESPLRALTVGSQPQAMDFYDTLSTEWWQNAANSSDPVVSGPFVDISGTNAYVVTFSQAVRVDGELLGVVAADVTVATLQALCQNTLLDLARPTSVVNHEGMVIATNAGTLLGSVVDMAVLDEGHRSPVPGTTWLVVTG